MAKKPKKISEQLRAAILGAEISRYRMAKETHLTEGLLSHFIHGNSGLSLESIDTLGELLGLELAVKKPKSKKSSTTKGK